MQGGVVPWDFKQDFVNPLIKKQTVKITISNLSFLSKVLEKVFANRLHEHVYKHHLSNDLQSAYKRLKSYFSDRYQSINISGTLSCLPFKVPQRSILYELNITHIK